MTGNEVRVLTNKKYLEVLYSNFHYQFVWDLAPVLVTQSYSFVKYKLDLLDEKYFLVAQWLYNYSIHLKNVLITGFVL